MEAQPTNETIRISHACHWLMRVYSRGHPLTPPSLGEGPRRKQEARRKKTGGLVDLDWWPGPGGPGEPGVDHGWKEEEEPGWHGVYPGVRPGLHLGHGRQLE